MTQVWVQDDLKCEEMWGMGCVGQVECDWGRRGYGEVMSVLIKAKGERRDFKVVVSSRRHGRMFQLR